MEILTQMFTFVVGDLVTLATAELIVAFASSTFAAIEIEHNSGNTKVIGNILRKDKLEASNTPPPPLREHRGFILKISVFNLMRLPAR